MPQRVVQTMVKWINKGNPSAEYKSARDCREMMKKFRCTMARLCNFDSYECEDASPKGASRVPLTGASVYQIIFTSCGSESNNMVVRSVVEAYRVKQGAHGTAKHGVHGAPLRSNAHSPPHIITSSIEHKSLLNCAVQLAKRGYTELTLIRPDKFGFIHPEDVAKNIRPNTILISIMSANNETGAINDIGAIGRIAKSRGIMFHTDCVQSFGKFLANPLRDNVDAFSISFHKLHGPAGMGAVIIKKSIIDKMGLEAEICGSQNGGMRGGTENMSGIAASFEGMLLTSEGRAIKNKIMLERKKYIMQKLAEYVPCRTYKEYLADKDIPASPNNPKKSLEVVFLSTCEGKYLPNTLLLAVVKRTGAVVCNGKMKSALERRGVIVSIGSACNTASTKASHVLTEMGVDDLIKKGTLRVSLGDDNTQRDVDVFVREFLCVLKLVSEGRKY